MTSKEHGSPSMCVGEWGVSFAHKIGVLLAVVNLTLTINITPTLAQTGIAPPLDLDLSSSQQCRGFSTNPRSFTCIAAVIPLQLHDTFLNVNCSVLPSAADAVCTCMEICLGQSSLYDLGHACTAVSVYIDTQTPCRWACDFSQGNPYTLPYSPSALNYVCYNPLTYSAPPTNPPTTPPTNTVVTRGPVSTRVPTAAPAPMPTNVPVTTRVPTPVTTSMPTNVPVTTRAPNPAPTPTDAPVTTRVPTQAPTRAAPTGIPTHMPSRPPTARPTSMPTNVPVTTRAQAAAPTSLPTTAPTVTLAALGGGSSSGDSSSVWVAVGVTIAVLVVGGGAFICKRHGGQRQDLPPLPPQATIMPMFVNPLHLDVAGPAPNYEEPTMPHPFTGPRVEMDADLYVADQRASMFINPLHLDGAVDVAGPAPTYEEPTMLQPDLMPRTPRVEMDSDLYVADQRTTPAKAQYAIFRSPARPTEGVEPVAASSTTYHVFQSEGLTQNSDMTA